MLTSTLYTAEATSTGDGRNGHVTTSDGRIDLGLAMPPALGGTGEGANPEQLYRDLADGPFFGHNRNQDVDQGFRDAFWLQSMACGHRGAYQCIAAFSATDFRPDLEKVDVPTLVIHGDDDQIVPLEVGGKRSAEMVDGATLTVYHGSGHALPDTDRDRLHADLLTFIDA